MAMKHLLHAAAIAFVLPGTAMAQTVCDMGGAAPVPVLETAKASFLSGDFETFARTTTKLMPQGPAAFGEGTSQLMGLFPDGFESCQTVAQRRDVGGMVQEVSTFNIAGQSSPMSLNLLAMPIRGEMQISLITFNTRMGAVLEELR